MADDVDDELSEMETRLREEGDCPEYYLSEEAENAILDRLWERVSDSNTKLQNDVLELKDDFRKLAKLIRTRIHLQDDANRLAGDPEQVGSNQDNRENDMSNTNQEEGKAKGFDVKKAAMVGGAVLATAGVGYGLGRWHANRIQQKQSQAATSSK